MEDTPDLWPYLFDPVRGRRARRHCVTREVWQLDLLHGDHWEVYKNGEGLRARCARSVGLVGRPPQGTILMAASVRVRKTKPRVPDLARRLASLTAGLTVARVLKADERELIVEFEDGTRLLVRGDQRLDISVT